MYPGNSVVIAVLGQSVEVLNITNMNVGPLQISIIVFQVLGYDDTTIERAITVHSSSPIFFQHYSRDNERSGELIPFDITSLQNSMQEELD